MHFLRKRIPRVYSALVHMRLSSCSHRLSLFICLCCRQPKTTMQKTHIFFMLMNFLSNLVLICCLGIGLYTRWNYLGDPAYVYIAFAGFVVAMLTLALVYYFIESSWGASLWRLYVGFIIGVIAFTEHSTFDHNNYEELMNLLFLISIGTFSFFEFVRRVFRAASTPSSIIQSLESFEILGVIISSIGWGKDFLPIVVLMISVEITLITVRLKCFLGLLNLALISIACGVIYFPKLHVIPANPFALSCFLCRVSIPSVLDLYFVHKSRIEQWLGIIELRSVFHKVLIIMVFVIEMLYLGLSSKLIVGHKEWFVVVPLFCVVAFIWFCYHIVFIIQCWLLSNRLGQCYNSYKISLGHRNFNQILSSKGLRYFCLLSQRLVCITLLTTFFLGAIGWNTKTPTSISILLLILPLEAAVLSLLWEMSSVLGGTCIGYGLITPSLTIRTDQTVTLLHPDVQHSLNSQATALLSIVQNFFSFHLVELFGCDFSSSGINEDYVGNKLKALFQKTTADGPCYDTFFIYYSGPVKKNGDWALIDDKSLSLGTIIDWWDASPASSESRLLFVLDTSASAVWVRSLTAIRARPLAIQTCYMKDTVDAESSLAGKIGEFTMDWMDYNSYKVREVDLHDPTRSTLPIFGTTKKWGDFHFRLPSDNDMRQYWHANFPSIIHPLMVITNYPKLAVLCSCCRVVRWCFRRVCTSYFTPKEIDTGHGFKLVRT